MRVPPPLPVAARMAEDRFSVLLAGDGPAGAPTAFLDLLKTPEAAISFQSENLK